MPSPEALALYETLREALLDGQAAGQGAAALRYHGMLHGLALLVRGACAESPAVLGAAPTTQPYRPLPEFVQLLANIVLRTQPEVHHVD